LESFRYPPATLARIRAGLIRPSKSTQQPSVQRISVNSRRPVVCIRSIDQPHTYGFGSGEGFPELGGGLTCLKLDYESFSDSDRHG
jgi:hypothetical protein